MTIIPNFRDVRVLFPKKRKKNSIFSSSGNSQSNHNQMSIGNSQIYLAIEYYSNELLLPKTYKNKL